MRPLRSTAKVQFVAPAPVAGRHPSATPDLPETDFTQTMTTEYRADRVVILQDRNGDPVLGVVVEIQRAIDERKRWSWPVYVAALRAQAKCPVALLVVCLDDETAAGRGSPSTWALARWCNPSPWAPTRCR